MRRYILLYATDDDPDSDLTIQEWSEGFFISATSFPHRIILQEARIEDAPALLALTKGQMEEILKEAWQGRFDWEDWYKDLRKAIFSRNVSVHVIRIDENEHVAGYLWFAEELDAIWLTSIMITDEWQGRGLGKVMMAFLAELARQKHKRYLRLGVQKNNTRALHFYLKLGFNAIDYVKHANTLILEKNVVIDRPKLSPWRYFAN